MNCAYKLSYTLHTYTLYNHGKFMFEGLYTSDRYRYRWTYIFGTPHRYKNDIEWKNHYIWDTPQIYKWYRVKESIYLGHPTDI